ncbi:hypothetical protein BpHYR1_040709 [Brachionus plicatilis]|uniref:Uncharacterized protein n=1 Tax=Brachionus plicatilis TaxID=10195 RepID=A0A3M7Q8L0_BRAPC|nr:hypothetical protein BpHYR1_040709 [Brachionus plicatilis]
MNVVYKATLYQLNSYLLCQLLNLIYRSPKTSRRHVCIKFRLETVYCNRIYYIGWNKSKQIEKKNLAIFSNNNSLARPVLNEIFL